ncbi:glycosyltransferase [Runella aurantiaca]|uniref:Glycosyltransferase n=1 Tax=Runella aurantiaca TaxID=2282308 RepID=A0A369IAY5_9BACT|nr:glycosyltransferase [Runella aurantiaca]RDB06899.1 glycosyltransferase [Runella aurantiaca]
MDIFYSTNWFLYPFLNILLGLFVVIVLVQLYYILFVFAKLLFQQPPVEKKHWPAVTVVVCAHNELENLRELLPMLNEQDYPNYEVVVMNDRSWDGTEEFAEEEANVWNKVRFVHIRQEYDHVTPKKYAVTTAVRGAKHEVILLTDADCRPTTDQWIKGMAACLTEEKQIVIGFSPYQKLDGFLNRLIRFETFYVAIQYLSLALAGKPYMAVGRNLMYSKSLFTQNKGFYTHLRVTGGDDDLLMNEIATGHNTAVCLNADAFMVSLPKTTWKDWYRQKKRHLSVSKYYKTGNKVRLAVLSGAHVLSWMLFLGLILGCLWNYQAFLAYIIIIGVLFSIRLVTQWIVLGLASRKLHKSVGWFAIPLMDLTLFVYYFTMSFVMWYNRRKKVRWR